MTNRSNSQLDRYRDEIRDLQRALRIEMPVVAVVAALTVVAYLIQWQPVIIGLLTAVTVMQSIRLVSLHRRVDEQRRKLAQLEKQLALDALTNAPRRQPRSVPQLVASLNSARRKKRPKPPTAG